jgi:hypothetical protein
MRDKLRSLLPVATGTVGISLLYGQLLLPGRVLADRDIPFLHLPMLTAFREIARQGIPYWNPWIHGGQPLLTNPHYAAFYPPTWLALVLPPYYTIGLLIVLHAAWAFTGAWRLAHRWGAGPAAASLAGLALVGAGAFVTSPNMLNLFMGMAWLPWAIVWFWETLQRDSVRGWRSAGVKAALALAAMLLAGSPIVPLLAGLALVCLCLEYLPRHWRRILRVIPVGLAGLAVAAIQILPTLRHLTDSTRGEGLAGTTATNWSTPPVRFLEWIWPRIFGDPMLTDTHLYFGYPGIKRAVPLLLSIYCGAFVLALAIGALFDRRTAHRRSLAAMMALGIFLSLGRFNPIYQGLLVKIPPFSMIRYPEKFLLLTTTAMILAAVLYWDSVLQRRRSGEPLTLKVPLVVVTLVLVSSAALYLAPLVAPDLTVQILEGSNADRVQWADAPSAMTSLPADVLATRAGYLGWQTFVSFLVWLGVMILLFLHLKPAVISHGLLVVLVLGAIAMESWYYSRTVNTTLPAARLLEKPEHLLDFPPSSGRIFSDVILFPPQELIFPRTRPEDRPALQRPLHRLDPYAANLWGYRYALNPDPDLMLSSAGQATLRSLIRESGLMSEGWSEDVYRFLGAWNAGIVVRRRSPDSQLAEYHESGQIPTPARLVRNPEVLDVHRGVSRVLFVPDTETAMTQVRAAGFNLVDFDVVASGDSDSKIRESEYSSNLDLISVEEQAGGVKIQYQTSTEAFLVSAITADRDWRATVNGMDSHIHTTALGQMGLELPAGRGEIVLAYRNPAVLWGALVTALSLLGCAWFSRERRMSHVD